MKNSSKRLLSALLMAGLLCGAAGAANVDAGRPLSEDASAYMTYRENEVVLKGADGIRITGGSFLVNDLRITAGQDPDGRNYPGQLHTLTDGKFTFDVGRSGSEDVASWFNAKLSGYNDPGVTGDRTTFDEAAGKLNFAFIGDLSLAVTTAEYPQGIEVTFPDAAIAQGSTTFSNNWWFGQLQGQHTRDSDGPDRVLALGTDAGGRTVYASFLRGSNSVNEISLEALHIPDAANDRAVKLPDVRAAFRSLPVDGSPVGLSGFPGNYDPTVNHIQGYAQYQDAAGGEHVFLTHSVSTASYAHILAGAKDTGEKLGFKTYLKDWKHPGGIQTLGDYLLVPSEQDTSAHVSLYDLRALPTQELRRVETFDLAVGHKAGALGITSYTAADGVEYYLLVVAHLNGENSVYHIYQAPAAQGLEAAAFSEVGSFPFSKDFQGFGLVTEAETNDVYLIGLWSPSEGATFADYAYLYQLDTERWTLGEELEQIHMVSSGGAPGVMGVHFRYGAGVYVTPEQKLLVSATERNTVLGSTLATNDWVSE